MINRRRKRRIKRLRQHEYESIRSILASSMIAAQEAALLMEKAAEAFREAIKQEEDKHDNS